MVEVTVNTNIEAGIETSGGDPVSSPAAFNIASCLPLRAAIAPDQPAIIVARAAGRHGRAAYETHTFADLEAASNRCAHGLAEAGIDRGMRTLVMVRSGLEFLRITFALFKLGAVPVMIDPGMGLGRMLDCIRQVDLQAFVGIPLAHVMRLVRRGPFKTVKHVVTVGRRWFWHGLSLQELERMACDTPVMADTTQSDVAAILFTSGSTGPAKGVVYEHGMLGSQVRAIQRHYGIEPGEIDVPTFPLFGLFSTGMGMTSVIPIMDPSRPARSNPARIVEAIQDCDATSAFGSPAVWKRVAAYGVEHGITLPRLRRILISGAPVPYTTLEQLHRMLGQNADVYTPYGATESLPVASIGGREVLADCSKLSREGAGTCVGKPFSGVDVRLIRITDHPIHMWSDELLVPEGQLGEIAVAGAAVTKEYFGLPEATALAKIADSNRTWHRIGDIGYRDEQGRLWFCGRKSHRVITENGTMLTVRCEAVFNEHPDVSRSALVGVGPVGRKRPVIVIEPEPGRFPGGRRRTEFREELLNLGRGNELTSCIRDIVFHRSFPVDVRHNAKINREALSVWAAKRIS